eukprot:903329-Amorphochlora_amoeboformis.AAC.1
MRRTREGEEGDGGEEIGYQSASRYYYHPPRDYRGSCPVTSLGNITLKSVERSSDMDSAGSGTEKNLEGGSEGNEHI